MRKRIAGQYDQWHDPHNNGTYTELAEYKGSLETSRLTGDKKYIFHNVSGVLFYDNNIKDCYSKMDAITLDIKKNINHLKHHKKKEYTHFLNVKSLNIYHAFAI